MKNFLDNQVKDEVGVAIAKHGLTVESVFIPFSQPRNAGEKYPSLNWKVTLKQNGRNILTTDYMAGCAHAPSYQQRETIHSGNAVRVECEHGGKAMESQGRWIVPSDKRGTIKPDSRDVIHSLLLDSEVLNYSNFEDWAGDFGYDEDSRSHEKIYQDCLKIALQFRKIGNDAITELQEAYQDY
jgi:hypothetical protein